MKIAVIILIVLMILVKLMDIKAPKKAKKESIRISQAPIVDFPKPKTVFSPANKPIHLPIPNPLKLDTHIQSIYYGFTNYMGADFSCVLYDLRDAAVHIEFVYGHWISWQWTEVGATGPEFQINYRKRNPLQLQQDFPIYFEEVTYLSKWKVLKHQSLQKIVFHTTSLTEGTHQVSELVLHFSWQKVIICGIPEPDPGKWDTVQDWTYDNNWTAVVFDEQILTERRKNFLT